MSTKDRGSGDKGGAIGNPSMVRWLSDNVSDNSSGRPSSTHPAQDSREHQAPDLILVTDFVRIVRDGEVVGPDVDFGAGQPDDDATNNEP